MEWLLAVWELLGREHAQAPLAALCGWPLLPTEGGMAYALPTSGLLGSRALELLCLGIFGRRASSFPLIVPFARCAAPRAHLYWHTRLPLLGRNHL